jgi:hypothetical protein
MMDKKRVYFTFGANLTHRTADAAERNETAEKSLAGSTVARGTITDWGGNKRIKWPLSVRTVGCILPIHFAKSTSIKSLRIYSLVPNLGKPEATRP